MKAFHLLLGQLGIIYSFCLNQTSNLTHTRLKRPNSVRDISLDFLQFLSSKSPPPSQLPKIPFPQPHSPSPISPVPFLCQVPSQSFLCGRWKPFSAIMYQYCAKIYFVCTLPFAQFSAVILKTNVIGTILK